MAIQFDNTNTGVATLKPATTGTLALTLPAADGTSGQALTTNGSGQLAFTTVGGGGGLTGFTAAESTAAPNATVNVDSLTASAASTNADVAFVAKGTGATLAQVPDSTTAGGDKRGTYATDWQKVRSASTQVASGTFSVISGGLNNTASGSQSFVGGGINNTASALRSSVLGGADHVASDNFACLAGGNANTASQISAGVFCGSSNNVSSNRGVILGGSTNTASGITYASIVGGFSNTSSGDHGVVLGGRGGTNRGIAGAITCSASIIPVANGVGFSQTSLLVLGRTTTDATATVLASESSAPSTTNQVILPNNSAYYFRGEVIAGVTGAGNTKGWYVEGVIKRGANAASTALVGTPTVTSSYADAGASAWTITATADTTNGGLAITVTGAAATTIRWVAQIRTTEMTY